MFDHVTIRCSNRDLSEVFYKTVLETLGVEVTNFDDEYVQFGDFSIAQASDYKPPTRRLHIGFVARSRALVDSFWEAGRAAGYRDDGPPGLRPQYRDDYYGAFLLDPDGNSAEAVNDGALREGGVIDHLWLRVSDVAAARDFYAIAAGHAGFQLNLDTPERAQFRGSSGSFSLVPGKPTDNVHMAFPVTDNERVRGYYRDATAAGHRDDGAPGERPQYHPGYYGAFVLDPDGNSVELVDHHGA